MEIALFALLGGIILWLNIAATLAIARDSLGEPQQRMLQLLLVWLLPVLGAVAVLYFHRPREKPTGKYDEPAELGEDYFPTRANRSSLSDADAD